MEKERQFRIHFDRNFIDYKSLLFIDSKKNCFTPDMYCYLTSQGYEIIQLKGEKVKDLPQPKYNFQNDWDITQNELLENQRTVYSEVAVMSGDPFFRLGNGVDMHSQLLRLGSYERNLNLTETRMVMGRYADYLFIDDWFKHHRGGSIFAPEIFTRTTSMMGERNIIFGNLGQTLKDVEVDKKGMTGISILPLIVPHRID